MKNENNKKAQSSKLKAQSSKLKGIIALLLAVASVAPGAAFAGNVCCKCDYVVSDTETIETVFNSSDNLNDVYRVQTTTTRDPFGATSTHTITTKLRTEPAADPNT